MANKTDLQNLLQQALDHHRTGRLHQAEALYRQILLDDPNNPDALHLLGMLAHEEGKIEVAVELINKALSYRPDYPEAHYNLGNALMDQGKLKEAAASFRQALNLNPNFAEAANNLGVIYKNHGKLDKAIDFFHKALALRPEYIEAHYNLGNAFMDQGKPDEAIISFQRALTLKPNYLEAHYNLGNALIDHGKLNEAIASFRRALDLKPDFFIARSNLLLCLNYLPNLSNSHYFSEARQYGQKAAESVRQRFSEWSCTAKPKRLRVGFVSGDFRNHSVGFFLESMLANLDKDQIELVAFPTHLREDELTARIRPNFKVWKPISGMEDEAAARLIHANGVHVLLDLSGHTRHNRLPVFAWKPAPVQASWLGYSASTGLAEMDYLLADPYAVLPEEEGYFTETIWRFPESYLCFSPPQVSVEVGPLPARKEGRITFGSFNNPTKMNDAVVLLWAKVLQAVPGSRLFLKAKQFSNQSMLETTRQHFAAFGIASERLLLQGYIPRIEDHFAAYNRMDVALDPFPYNGTTTSVQGLWMGVPFITRQGNRFISRVGESIAHNAGMADWIAKDNEDYVEKAVAYTADLENLALLRARLRKKLSASSLLNAPRFARNFEAAMWGMWNRFQTEQ